jgi:integrase
MLGLLLGCGLRRSEVVGLKLDQLQSREGHWVIVNLVRVSTPDENSSFRQVKIPHPKAPGPCRELHFHSAPFPSY